MMEKTNRAEKIDAGHMRQEGEGLVNEFFQLSTGNPVQFLEDSLKNTPKDQQLYLKREILAALVSHIVIPAPHGNGKELELVGKALSLLIKDSRFPEFYRQFIRISTQYFEEIAHCEADIRDQYTDRLREKEEKLSHQSGRPVRVDLSTDPEFADIYNKKINSIREDYESIAEQVREQSLLLFPT
ncbi:hypothetical protein FACS1894164_06290 [Spirochaetia bacterium]|nr:hypothetical protein FACS1894164_06290 [Spirochaetia bacterium]